VCRVPRPTNKRAEASKGQGVQRLPVIERKKSTNFHLQKQPAERKGKNKTRQKSILRGATLLGRKKRPKFFLQEVWETNGKERCQVHGGMAEVVIGKESPQGGEREKRKNRGARKDLAGLSGQGCVLLNERGS